jgi:DNA-binding transcriptional regulator YhcF (GntR family)
LNGRLRIAERLHAGQQRESAVFDLHHHALQGLLRFLVGNFQQLQRHGLVLAQHLASCDAEQQGITDLASGAGDGHADGLLAHELTPGKMDGRCDVEGIDASGIKCRSGWVARCAAIGPMSPSPKRPIKPVHARGAAAFRPLYRQIKQLIVQDMQAGVWKPGEMIPSEFELADRFGVSQGTVRKAIDDLAAENLLTRRQGKGTFVATHAEQTTRYRFLRLAADDGSGRDLQRRLLHCRRMRAGADVARPLELKSGDPVVFVRRLLLAEAGRSCWTTSGCRAGCSKGSTPNGCPPIKARCTRCSKPRSACR